MALNFEDSSDEILWMADALQEGYVEPKTSIEVVQVLATKNGRGFLVKCLHNGLEICDYAWAKSTVGKVLKSLCENPREGDDQVILCRCQAAVKNAVLSVISQAGTAWVPVDLEDGRLGVERVDLELAEPTPEKSKKGKSSSQQSQLQDNSTAV